MSERYEIPGKLAIGNLDYSLYLVEDLKANDGAEIYGQIIHGQTDIFLDADMNKQGVMIMTKAY